MRTGESLIQTERVSKVRTEKQKDIHTAVGLIAAFALWTAAVRFADVQPIGPNGSAVGLAAINGFFHSFTGVHMTLYLLTDWFSLVPVGFAVGFAFLGLGQWVKRKHLRNVDRSILVLGGFYIAVLAAYCFFEAVPVNYRPVLINGALEASYPSSTTMLVLCVMPTAIAQLHTRIGSLRLRKCAAYAANTFMVLMVVGRLLSGVHWFTDIIGGILLSAGLVKMYQAIAYSGQGRP